MARRRKQELTEPYYVEHRFRCMTAEQIGLAQTLLVDEGWSKARVARRFRVSVSTIARVRRAIPHHLVAFKRGTRKLQAVG